MHLGGGNGQEKDNYLCLLHYITMLFVEDNEFNPRIAPYITNVPV